MVTYNYQQLGESADFIKLVLLLNRDFCFFRFIVSEQEFGSSAKGVIPAKYR